jgi:hypothetical protein
VSQNNVVAFETSVRRTMARRGSPDKTLTENIARLDCPYCGAFLRLEAVRPSECAEVLCADCQSVIEMGDPETVDSSHG